MSKTVINKSVVIYPIETTKDGLANSQPERFFNCEDIKVRYLHHGDDRWLHFKYDTNTHKKEHSSAMFRLDLIRGYSIDITEFKKPKKNKDNE